MSTIGYDALRVERDQADAVADSMQHFADVAVRCERKSNEYAAENAALRATVARVEAVAGTLDDLSRDFAFAKRDAYEDAATHLRAALDTP